MGRPWAFLGVFSSGVFFLHLKSTQRVLKTFAVTHVANWSYNAAVMWLQERSEWAPFVHNYNFVLEWFSRFDTFVAKYLAITCWD